jgi:hypothetical protein
MAVHVWTSDGYDFELEANVSLDETVQRIRAAMDGAGSLVEFDLASGHTMVFNGRNVAWAAAFNTDDAANADDRPSIVNYTTMILTEGGASRPQPRPRPR